MSVPKVVRRGAIAFFGTVALCSAVLAGAYGIAQTETGRRWIADRASALASDGALTVGIAGLGGGFPFSVRVDRIEVRQRGALLADLRDLRVDWAPLALLSGVVHVESVTAESVSLVTGSANDGAAELETDADGTSAGGLGLPVDVAIDRIRIGRLAVDAPGGVRAVASVDAAFVFRRDGRQLDAKIDLQRLDRPGHVRAEIKHVASPARFELRADLQDAPDGLIGALTGLPGLPALEARIGGSGPADRWQGTVDASADGKPVFRANLEIAVGAETSVGITSSVRTGTLVPPALVALVGPQAALSARLRLGSDNAMLLEAFEAVSGRATLRMKGRYNPADGATDATATVGIDGTPAAGPPGGFSLGGMTLEARATGRLPDVAVTLSGSVRDLTVPEAVRIGSAGFSGSATASRAFGSVRFDTRLTLGDARLGPPGGTMEILPSATLELSGEARDLKRIVIDAATLTSPLIEARLSNGQADLETGALTAVVDARVPRFSSIAALRSFATEGTLSLNGELAGNLDTGGIDAVIAGRVDGLVLADAAALPGLAQIDFSGQIRAASGGRIDVTAFQLDSALGRMTADASFELATARVGLRGQGIVSDLAALSGVVGTQVRGSAGFSLAYEGTPPDGGGNLRVLLNGVAVGPV